MCPLRVRELLASGPPSGDGSPAGASRPRPHGRASPPPAAVAAAPPSQLFSKPGALPPAPMVHRTREINVQGIKRLTPRGAGGSASRRLYERLVASLVSILFHISIAIT